MEKEDCHVYHSKVSKAKFGLKPKWPTLPDLIPLSAA